MKEQTRNYIVTTEIAVDPKCAQTNPGIVEIKGFQNVIDTYQQD